ncbi:hypothetical protein M422DRAFT_260295 [Sphaerobolus stellatus SS14]|uniref:Uncharacterized protein n=1 Tax=Sphaerobolus stellatus (strain SS14) TaxID=990650 RepID=A0A0C9VIJ5_SPHS4|nr:hypothetical protein M422DRAFT_260295 [Sphaerobolus stellatus SS14]
MAALGQCKLCFGLQKQYDRLRVLWYVWMEAVMRAGWSGDKWFTLRWSNTTNVEPFSSCTERAQQHSWGFQPDDMVVEPHQCSWCAEKHIASFRNFFVGLDSTLFHCGSVVEVFLCLFGLYMYGVHGEQANKEWWMQACRNVKLWIRESITQLDAGLLAEHEQVLKSFQTPWKKKKGELKNLKQSVTEASVSVKEELALNILSTGPATLMDITPTAVENNPEPQGVTAVKVTMVLNEVSSTTVNEEVSLMVLNEVGQTPLEELSAQDDVEQLAANGVDATTTSIEVVAIQLPLEGLSTQDVEQVDWRGVDAADSSVVPEDIIVTAGRMGGKGQQAAAVNV